MYLDEYQKGIYMYIYSGIQFCTIAQFLIENVPFQTVVSDTFLLSSEEQRERDLFRPATKSLNQDRKGILSDNQ